MFKNKSILVTGAGGFIGSHLVEQALRGGAEVTAFVHYNSKNDYGHLKQIPKEIKEDLTIVSGDISDFNCVKRAVDDKDIVFHLAALIGIPYSYYAPYSYVSTNINGTLNVMQSCLNTDVKKIIHTSTSEVYGTAQYTPIDEKHPLVGQSPYSASKIGADKIAESFFCSFGLPVATIRPFNTYGPRQSTRAVIPTIITQALSGDTVRLGSLDTVRDFNFVLDTVGGFLAIASHNSTIGKTINIGSGKAITIGELAKMIITQINPDITILVEEERKRPESSEVMNLICDNTYAKTLLNWSPEYTISRGITETIDWMRDHIREYDPGLYTL